MTSTPPLCRVGSLRSPPASTNLVGRELEVSYKEPSAPRLPAEDERDLQGEAVTGVGRCEAGEVADLSQPVPHRVGVAEQGAGGRLERASLTEVRRQGLDQRVAAGQQRQ